jgi:hypothetical protein
VFCNYATTLHCCSISSVTIRVEGKEPFCHVVPPTLGGHRMSGVTAKFNTPNLTATSDIPVSLFILILFPSLILSLTLSLFPSLILSLFPSLIISLSQCSA